MKIQNSNHSIYDTTIQLIIVLLIIVWCLMIISPFANILLWGLILAIALNPLHSKIAAKLGGKPKLASFLIVFFGFAIVLVPSWFLTDSLIQEVKGLKKSYNTNGISIPAPPETLSEGSIIGEKVYVFWKGASEDLAQTLNKYEDQVVGFGKKLAKGVLSMIGDILQMILSLLIAAFMLTFGGIGESIRKFYRKLAGHRGDEFADITVSTVRSVLKGVIGVAFIMAFLYGVCFALAGVPYTGILVIVIFVLTLFQITGLVIAIPVIVYLFIVRDTVPAVVWTVIILIVGTADNFVTPFVIGRGAPVPMLVIYTGVIGGFMLSGFIGLFTGAIVLSLGYKLFMGWMDSRPETKQT